MLETIPVYILSFVSNSIIQVYIFTHLSIHFIFCSDSIYPHFSILPRSARYYQSNFGWLINLSVTQSANILLFDSDKDHYLHGKKFRLLNTMGYLNVQNMTRFDDVNEQTDNTVTPRFKGSKSIGNSPIIDIIFQFLQFILKFVSAIIEICL